MADKNDDRSDSLIARVKRNAVVAWSVVSIVVIGLAKFTTSIEEIRRFFAPPSTPASALSSTSPPVERGRDNGERIRPSPTRSDCKYIFVPDIGRLSHMSWFDASLSFDGHVRHFNSGRNTGALDGSELGPRPEQTSTLVLKNYDEGRYGVLLRLDYPAYPSDPYWSGLAKIGAEPFYELQLVGNSREANKPFKDVDLLAGPPTLTLEPMSENAGLRYVADHKVVLPECLAAAPGVS